MNTKKLIYILYFIPCPCRKITLFSQSLLPNRFFGDVTVLLLMRGSYKGLGKGLSSCTKMVWRKYISLCCNIDYSLFTNIYPAYPLFHFTLLYKYCTFSTFISIKSALLIIWIKAFIFLNKKNILCTYLKILLFDNNTSIAKKECYV